VTRNEAKTALPQDVRLEPALYFYQHIPKCGGRSFIHQCKAWFATKHDNPGSYPSKEQIEAFSRTRVDLESLPRPCLVHGHWINNGIRPHDRYGAEIAAGKARLITIVRDPLERRISAYFHRARKGRPWPEPLAHWLSRSRNPTANCLGVTAETWRSRLDSYFLVGATEELQLTLRLMAAETGNPLPPPAPHLNPSPREDYELAPEMVEQFRERNALDYEIHRYAIERVRREAGQTR
jgi:hypothetical protein